MTEADKAALLKGMDALGLTVTRFAKSEDGSPVVWVADPAGDRAATADELSAAGLEAVRRAKRDAINRQRAAVIAAGFHHNFGGDIGTRTFDQRGPTDETAWLGLKSLADDLIAMGEGDTLLAVRDAANETFEAPASSLAEALRTMGAWRALVAKRAWDLKDEAVNAADAAAIEAVDVISGWP